MNYYNPYFFNPNISNTSLLSRIFGNINFSSILNGASKTLNFVNQTIPVIKQIKPMINNAKTMFNVINEFRKVDEVKKTTNNINEVKVSKTENNEPTFFI